MHKSPSSVYIAVHAGAGNHGKTSERAVRHAMKRACCEALRVASLPGADALSMVEQAIIELEDDENLNAGTGSNLTLDGVVECDAAIMDGITSDFGSIGAVPGVKNPIRLASTVLRHSRKPDVLGRIRPLTLVSNGAHEFARRNGVETVPPESMISPQAARDWQKWVERYKDAREGVVSEVDPLPDDVMQDTVGAVGLDSFGNMAAGVSSGGLLLKYSGRVGEAAVFGAGCWAQLSSDGRTGLACSISGVGEHIIQAGLARAIGDAYWSSERIERQGHGQVDVHELLVSILTERFYRPASDRGTARPNAGVLLLTREAQEDGSVIPLLWCAFTAESMAIAYASSDKPVPKAMILRRPQSANRFNSSEMQPVYITALQLHA